MTRIVGGLARGARLTVPDEGTRPTSDRAREAVFSSLEARLGPWTGARVLDLYAGSGACGLEAASRGAAHVDLVESSRAAARVIADNVDAVAAASPDVSVHVHQSTVQRWLAGWRRGPAPYDVVFCDPPYATPDAKVHEVLSALLAASALAPSGVVVLERSARAAPWRFAPPLRAVWDRRYGEAHLWVAEAAADA
jgi:16S rRNA (guanine966-N2)-methyltransferase